MSDDKLITLMDKAAVLESMPEHPGLKAILAWNADSLIDAKFDRGEMTLTISKDAIRGACAAIQAAGYNAFLDMTAVDWYPTVPRFQLIYHICSHRYKEVLRLRAMVDESDASVESIASLWAGATYS